MNKLLISRTNHKYYNKKEGIIYNYFSENILPFLIEEIAASLTTQVLVPNEILDSKLIENIPAVIKKRIVPLRKIEKIISRAEIFISPIAEEFKFLPNMEWYRVTSQVHPIVDSEESARICFMTNYIFRHLVLLLIGVKYKCQIECDLKTIILFASNILRSSRNPKSRFNLKVLISLAKSYKKVSVPSLLYQSDLSKEHLLEFEKLLLDEEYDILSKDAFSLGNPTKIRNTLERIRVKATLLVNKEHYVLFFKLFNRMIHAVTGLNLYEKEDWSHFEARTYYPPVVSFDSWFMRVMKNHGKICGYGNLVQSKVGPNWDKPILK